MFTTARKVVVAVLLSNCLLLQQVLSHPVQLDPAQSSPLQSAPVQSSAVESAPVQSSAVESPPAAYTNGIQGSPGSQAAYSPIAFGVQQNPHPGAIGVGDGTGNLLFLSCHDCGHGRR